MPSAIHGYGQEKLRHITYSLRCARSSGLGFRKTPVGLTPFVVFYYSTFFAALERFAFLYRAAKNVVNLSRYTTLPHFNHYFFVTIQPEILSKTYSIWHKIALK